MAIPFRSSLRRLLQAVSVFALLGVVSGWATPPEAHPPGRFAFRTYTANLGLASLAITQLSQDRTGFLWVGTEDGLYRYDGDRFQGYSLKDGLPSSQITAIHQDPKGVLWVGTFGGLAHWNGHAFEGMPGVPEVQGLATAPSGELWVATTQGPFIHSGGSLHPAPGWPGGEASAIYARASGGAVWVARWTTEKGRPLAQVLRWQAGAWQSFAAPPEFGQERIDAALADWQGRMWVRSSRHLWMLPSGGDRFVEPLPSLPAIRSRGFLAPSRDGGIWVTSDHGLHHAYEDTWRHLGTPEGLPTTWSRTVLEDREGNIWYSSLGLHRLLGLGAWQGYTTREGLPSDVVRTVLRDRGGQLWVGTDQGLAKYDSKGGQGRWSTVPGTAGNSIRTVVEGKDGGLCMAGAPAEVLSYDPRTQRIDRFGAAAGLAGKGVFRLLLDAEGTLWVATEGAGLLKGSHTGGTWRFAVEALPGGDAHEYVSDLYQDAQGRIYAAGAKGLAIRSGSQWRRITTREGLRRDHVAYVSGTRDGTLLLAYFEPMGITLAKLEGEAFRVLSHQDSSSALASDKVYSLGADAKGRIWAGTARGVDILGAEGTEHFGLADGLVGEDCSAQALLAEPDGGVWIGTASGLAHYLRQGGPETIAPPPTVLLGFRLGDTSYGDIYPSRLRVDVRHNTLEAHFAGLSFAREGAVQHQVRLVGIEQDWHLTEAKAVRYPSLPKGQYLFEVRSRVGGGLWGEPQRRRFEVLPAWWETWWCRLLGLLALSSLVAWAIRRYTRGEARRREALEALVAKRTSELEIANRALQDQTITDPLTGLRNRRFLQFQMPEDAAQAERRHRLLSLTRAERLDLNIDMVFIMVDIDHFKEINDLFGHAAGDRVLSQVAAALLACIRDTDAAVRWGGEEFLVVAHDTSRRECTILVERIRSAIALHPFDLGEGRTIHRTCSIGYTCFPFIPEEPRSFDWERVVEIADQCLYAAKHGGRDAWVGVYPDVEVPAEHIQEVLAHGSIEPLVADASLVVKSSLRGTGKLDWKKANSLG